MGLLSKIFGGGTGKPSRTAAFPSAEFTTPSGAITAMISRQREHWAGGWVSVTLGEYKGDDDGPAMIQIAGGEGDPDTINLLLRRAPESVATALGLVEKQPGLYLVPDSNVAQLASLVEALLAELFHVGEVSSLKIEIDAG
ncbi:MAG: hypothetical protein IT432_07655 [Phycisphaerales bacterium]|nr:hypothetical protein [Phycisphaerales bacterium]